ncbi:hypothetical protein GLIP_4065 [Aliiglaciecola lipolytica E3]|uniref:Uncharacterized protein n=1 Tax=Aliiglaciecola lipolytica E3 TaxID=1127673 RepID=K6XYF0_9ALTE|nr:hypothetical protein GLIP_4065 [Aliiglaciecola lipolytica E3]
MHWAKNKSNYRIEKKALFAPFFVPVIYSTLQLNREYA